MQLALKKMQKCLSQVGKCRVPVVAQTQGYCLGAAVDLLSCCDIVYADKNTKFSIREVKIGMSPDLGTV